MAKPKKPVAQAKPDKAYRYEANKRRRQERHQRRVAAALIKRKGVPRGAARRIRRALKQQEWAQRQGG